jgi:hypothetical protein
MDEDRIRAALGGELALRPEDAARLGFLRERVLALASPAGRVCFAEIRRKEADRVVLEDGAELDGAGIGALLRRADAVALFVVTLGPGPEREAGAAAQAGRMRDAVLLDALASEAAEDLARAAQRFVEERAAQEGRATTRRFSPGYCDWPLEAQRVLDGLVRFEDVGVILNENCILQPEKTITAVMGIGAAGSLGRAIAARPACAACERRHTCPGPDIDPRRPA